MKIFIIAIIGSFLLSGCASKITVCPGFPKPKQETLKQLKDLNNKNVDDWIEDLFRLNKKLKECNNV